MAKFDVGDRVRYVALAPWRQRSFPTLNRLFGLTLVITEVNEYAHEDGRYKGVWDNPKEYERAYGNSAGSRAWSLNEVEIALADTLFD